MGEGQRLAVLTLTLYRNLNLSRPVNRDEFLPAIKSKSKIMIKIAYGLAVTLSHARLTSQRLTVGTPPPIMRA